MFFFFIASFFILPLPNFQNWDFQNDFYGNFTKILFKFLKKNCKIQSTPRTSLFNWKNRFRNVPEFMSYFEQISRSKSTLYLVKVIFVLLAFNNCITCALQKHCVKYQKRVLQKQRSTPAGRAAKKCIITYIIAPCRTAYNTLDRNIYNYQCAVGTGCRKAYYYIVCFLFSPVSRF